MNPFVELWRVLVRIAAAAMLATLSIAHAAAPQLTAAPWVLTGVDTSGVDWSGSTITFESQSAAGSDFAVGGYFYWTGDGGLYFGRENFSGTLFSDNHLTILGTGIVPPASGIVSGATYDADVTAQGNRMINGTWGGGGVVPSNAWVAVQVPEPGSFALLLMGAAAVGLVARRGRRSP